MAGRDCPTRPTLSQPHYNPPARLVAVGIGQVARKDDGIRGADVQVLQSAAMQSSSGRVAVKSEVVQENPTCTVLYCTVSMVPSRPGAPQRCTQHTQLRAARVEQPSMPKSDAWWPPKHTHQHITRHPCHTPQRALSLSQVPDQSPAFPHTRHPTTNTASSHPTHPTPSQRHDTLSHTSASGQSGPSPR